MDSGRKLQRLGYWILLAGFVVIVLRIRIAQTLLPTDLVGCALFEIGELFLIPGGEARGEDAVHRAGQPLGERLSGILQRQAKRRTARAGGFRHVTGSEGAYRALAKTLCQSALKTDPPSASNIDPPEMVFYEALFASRVLILQLWLPVSMMSQ